MKIKQFFYGGDNLGYLLYSGSCALAIDGGAVDRLAGESTVEVNDMEPLETLRLEGPGLGGGVVVEDGRLVHAAELEADALAVLQVDGGI